MSVGTSHADTIGDEQLYGSVGGAPVVEAMVHGGSELPSRGTIVAFVVLDLVLVTLAFRHPGAEPESASRDGDVAAQPGSEPLRQA